MQITINWSVFIIAAFAFLLALGIQSFVQKRVLSATVDRLWWIKNDNEAIKLVRQDVTGIIVGIGITNALLAAILAVLILRP